MARLRSHLTWIDTPKGVLQALKERLQDAERELPRTGEASQQARIKQEITELGRQIIEQQHLLDDPHNAARLTDERIALGLEEERRPEKPRRLAPRAKFINQPPMVAPWYFRDRHVETSLVADFLRTPNLRVMTIGGRSGTGKTAMVCRLLQALEGGRLPDELGALPVGSSTSLQPASTW